MEKWSNIEFTAQDSEIAEINNLEISLGQISPEAEKIRELITRFEVCHFKYQQHLRYILESIDSLKPIIDASVIGLNHIKNGDSAWERDKTGRSLLGQQYLWILRKWLTLATLENSRFYNQELEYRIIKWLGERDSEKERLVELLIARLTYDWNSYERLQHGGQYKELELQVCRMDICHYSFPKHMDTLLQAIGQMKPKEDLEGCGSNNADIKDFIENKFSEIFQLVEDLTKSNKNFNQAKRQQIKIWLYVSFLKTIKEQTGIQRSIPNTGIGS